MYVVLCSYVVVVGMYFMYMYINYLHRFLVA